MEWIDLFVKQYEPWSQFSFLSFTENLSLILNELLKNSE